MNDDTTDLLAADTGREQGASAAAPPATRTRRRATSSGTLAAPTTGSADPAPANEPASTAPKATAPTTTAPKATSAKGGLSALLLPELQGLAADLGLSGTGKMRKSQLIEAIQAQQSAAKAPVAAASEPASEPAQPTEPTRTEPTERGERTDRDRDRDRDTDSDRGSDGDDEDTDSGQDSGERTDQDGGERPSRVDRGRERFLEREAKRQERVAALVAEGLSEEEATAAVAAERPQRDRQNQDRPPRQDRQPVAAGQAVQGAQARQGDGPREDDEDEFGNRRGRFRERGRGRGRNRDRTYPGSGEPELAISDDDVLLPIAGILDILDNYGFVRTTGYLTGPNDVYVSLQQVRKYDLRRGDAVTGAVRQLREGEQRAKYNALVRLDTINGLDPEESKRRPEFSKLTPLYPQERLRLETTPDVLITRVIDLVMPVGKGQRALIVSPPRAGKTTVLKAIANAITTNNPECHLMVVLVDERPEEVTEMQRAVKGEVIASTFDRPPVDHITAAELGIERAKRLVELGNDVVVLLDSVTRLGRAYNLGAPASGRILTGGVDSAALYPPKRFLGAARNIENGGSLTIFATAQVETGSAMDTVLLEEFTGTGNAELTLDRHLAEKRIFPAIDVDASGTRKEEILLAPQEVKIVHQLRRVLHALDTGAALEMLLDKLKATRTNVEFLMQIQKSTVDADRERIDSTG